MLRLLEDANAWQENFLSLSDLVWRRWQSATWQGWNNRDETVSTFCDVFAKPSQNDKMLTKDEGNLESTTKADRNWGRTLELLKRIFLPLIFYFNVINQDGAVSDFGAETASAMFANVYKKFRKQHHILSE